MPDPTEPRPCPDCDGTGARYYSLPGDGTSAMEEGSIPCATCGGTSSPWKWGTGVVPEPTDPHPKVVDLMEALQQSVDEARAARKAHRQAHQPPDEAEVEDEGYPAAYPEPSGARVIAPCGNVASAYTVPALGLCPANRAVRCEGCNGDTTRTLPVDGAQVGAVAVDSTQEAMF